MESFALLTLVLAASAVVMISVLAFALIVKKRRQLGRKKERAAPMAKSELKTLIEGYRDPIEAVAERFHPETKKDFLARACLKDNATQIEFVRAMA